MNGSLLEPVSDPPQLDWAGWLVTFSDLVLQLFAFVTVAAVLEIGADRLPSKLLATAHPSTPADSPSASIWPEVTPAPFRRDGRRTGYGLHAMSVPSRGAERARSEARDDPTSDGIGAGASGGDLAVEGAAGAVAGSREVRATIDASVGLEPGVDAAGRAAVARADEGGLGRPQTHAGESPSAEAGAGSQARLLSLGRYFSELMEATGVEGAADVTVTGGGLTISLGEAVGFASGSVEIPAAGRALLEEVRSVARAMPSLDIEVSGHTDDRPIRTPRFPSNLHLSLARAARVAEALAAGDASLRRRIVATGYGAERPRASNETAAGRAQNRRVDVRLVPREPTSPEGRDRRLAQGR